MSYMLSAQLPISSRETKSVLFADAASFNFHSKCVIIFFVCITFLIRIQFSRRKFHLTLFKIGINWSTGSKSVQTGPFYWHRLRKDKVSSYQKVSVPAMCHG